MTAHTTPMMRVVIAARYKAGDTMRSLGKVFGLHPSTVRKIVVDQGVELRPTPLRGRRPGSRVLDDAQRAEVVGKYAQGATVRQLAAEYRVAYGTVHGLLKAAGVEFRRPGGRT